LPAAIIASSVQAPRQSKRVWQFALASVQRPSRREDDTVGESAIE